MLGVSGTPDLDDGAQFLSHTKREASLDELNSLFERNVGSGCEKGVEVIGHQDEFVEMIFVLSAVALECVEK
jgi:hypothetical protein